MGEERFNLSAADSPAVADYVRELPRVKPRLDAHMHKCACQCLPAPPPPPRTAQALHSNSCYECTEEHRQVEPVARLPCGRPTSSPSLFPAAAL